MKKSEVDDLLMTIFLNSHLEGRYDIPYLAGYSLDGKKIFIDKDCPWFFGIIPIYKFLLIHEYIEKKEIDKGYDYRDAHQKATEMEKQAVNAYGLDWEKYDEFLKKYIKMADHKELKSLPHDLDLTPYIDMHDYEQLKKINRV